MKTLKTALLKSVLCAGLVVAAGGAAADTSEDKEYAGRFCFGGILSDYEPETCIYGGANGETLTRKQMFLEKNITRKQAIAIMRAANQNAEKCEKENEAYSPMLGICTTF